MFDPTSTVVSTPTCTCQFGSSGPCQHVSGICVGFQAVSQGGSLDTQTCFPGTVRCLPPAASSSTTTEEPNSGHDPNSEDDWNYGWRTVGSTSKAPDFASDQSRSASATSGQVVVILVCSIAAAMVILVTTAVYIRDKKRQHKHLGDVRAFVQARKGMFPLLTSPLGNFGRKGTSSTWWGVPVFLGVS